MKKLNELYKNIDSDVFVRGIRYKVDEVKSGDLFFCLAKNNVDRYTQVDEAIKNGAVGVVVDGDVGYRNVPVIKVDSPKRELIYLSRKYYDDPDDILNVIGVTGTEGKSSVGMIIQQLLGLDNCGYLGNDFRKCHMFREDNDDFIDPVKLYGYLDEFVKFNCSNVVLESSSLLLANGVLEPVDYDVCVYTNISSDHLDIHGNFDNYMMAKLRMFEQTKSDGIKVLNKDDIYFERVAKVCKDNYVTYGMDNDCTLQIVEYRCMYNKTSIKFKYKDQEFSLFSPLLGDFNVSNLAAALLVCLEMDVELELLLTRIEKIKLEGHMVFLNTNDIYKVMVDYAHTHNSIFRLLSFIKTLNYDRIIVVVGQEGEKNFFRRSHVGEIVVKNSNYAIFTSDNPRGEDPTKICNEIVQNIKNYANYEIIINRDAAIKKAIDMADEGDLVLILGKKINIEVIYSAIVERNIRESTF